MHYLARLIGPNRAALANWIRENMPALEGELAPMRLDEVRTRLNEETGLCVSSTDLVEDGSARYLEALKIAHATRLAGEGR